MEAAFATLASLRDLIESATVRLGFDSLHIQECYPFSLLPPGLPRGALSVLSGPGKTELLMRFLSENPELRVAWVEDQISIYPCAIFQREARLRRFLFAESGKDSVWALLQLLRSQLFNLVVFSSTPAMGEMGQAFYRNERVLRGLQIAAEKSRTSMVILSDEPVGAWPVSLELRVQGSGVEVLRRRR